MLSEAPRPALVLGVTAVLVLLLDAVWLGAGAELFPPGAVLLVAAVALLPAGREPVGDAPAIAAGLPDADAKGELLFGPAAELLLAF